MPGFEAVIQVALDDLCPDCPMRNLCANVEMARVESEFQEGDNVEEQLAAIEADAAASIALASVYKSRVGCSGADQHEEICDCGNDKSCPAYGAAVDLINED